MFYWCRKQWCALLKLLNFFGKLVNGWEVFALDVVGQSGGLASVQNPQVIFAKPYRTYARILLEGKFMSWNLPISFLNYYNPYNDKLSFWSKVHEDGLLQDENLILGGDLNLTLIANELWGSHI